MAIYAFDGTTCTPSHLSNVFRMYDAYNSRNKFYATGPGSRGGFLAKIIEGTTGHGGQERIHDAFEIWKYWQRKKSRETIVIGFSRGAVMAREFANKVCEAGGGVDFLGLYDSVGAFGNPLNMTDVGYRKSIPSGVKYCAQALSIHEERFTFRVIRANLAPNNRTTYLVERWFNGVHSDVGGTLKKELGAESLVWMLEEAKKAQPNQWDEETLIRAKEIADCQEEPSKNKVTLPKWFMKSIRTRNIKKSDTIDCIES